MRDPYSILIRPILTEKSVRDKDLYNKVTFEVAPDANKIEIKKAVETIFKVKVRKVNTMRMKGKPVRFGMIRGRRKGYKKAVVTLYPGQKIEFFEGV